MIKIIINLWLVFSVIATVISFFNDVSDISKKDFSENESTTYKPSSPIYLPEKPSLRSSEKAKKAREEHCKKYSSDILCRSL